MRKREREREREGGEGGREAKGVVCASKDFYLSHVAISFGDLKTDVADQVSSAHRSSANDVYSIP